MKKEIKKVPTIRFKEFTDDWEQRKLGDIADRVTEKNTFLMESETFTNSAEFGIISQRDFFDHDITNKENIGNYYIVRPEDFVYNPRISVTASVGPINRNKLGRNGIVSPLYTVFRPYDVDKSYLEYYFKTDSWHAFMKFNGDSGARSDRFSIRTELFYEMPLPIPSIEEQKRIGQFLVNLSAIITLHQRKLKQLQTLKKYFLQNMFPAKEEKVPAIRFKGFTDDWEQRKLPDLLKKSTGAMKIGPFGSALKKDIYVSRGIKVYAQENIFKDDFSIGNYYITENKYKELQSCELFSGDIVITAVYNFLNK